MNPEPRPAPPAGEPCRTPPLVVKIGGSRLDSLDGAWWDDLAHRARTGPLILVHGWSRPLQRYDPRHRRPDAVLRDRYGNQSRWTTADVLVDIKAVSAVVRAGILRRLTHRGVTAAWLLGSDGLISAGPAERLWWRGGQLTELRNLVGPPTGVDAVRLVHTRPGHVCLVTPLARDPDGQEVNTDADRAAAAIAGAVGAADLLLVTDTPHLLLGGAPVRRITREDAAAGLRDTAVTGGMRKKLRAAHEALGRGVGRVVIGDTTVTELLTARTGTAVTRA